MIEQILIFEKEKKRKESIFYIEIDSYRNI